MSEIVKSLEYVEKKQPIIDSYLGNGATDVMIISIIILTIILTIIFVVLYLRRTFFSKDVAPSSHNSGISFGDNAKIGGNVIQKGKE